MGDASLQVSDESLFRGTALICGALRSRGLKPEDDGSPRQLVRRLEHALGAPRMDWPGSVIRNLWQACWEVVDEREVSADHEAAWLNLVGILLRPGFGDPLDGERIDQLWGVFREGMAHESSLWSRLAWWVLWRRVSGGLDRGRQLELTNKLSQPLLTGAAVKAAQQTSKAKGKKGKKSKGNAADGMNRQEVAEMWRAVASLERIPATSKAGLGDVALRNAVAGRGDFAFWALGRIGARVPLYGPVEEAVARDKVEGWLDRLLALDWAKHPSVALCAVQLGRRCGDSSRDVLDPLREALVTRLAQIDCPQAMVRMVREVVVLGDAEKAQLFGDSVPTGLRLTTG